MSGLKELQRPIKEELQEFEKHFAKAMKSSTPLLDRITHYIVKRKGKQIRPMLVFLSAKMLGPVRLETYNTAALIELLHTATLVHDDVVDDAHMRRGFFSINAIWKNKIAVLVGDYLLSKGLLLSLEHEQYRSLQILSTAIREMSEGELLQIEKSRKLDITESVYYDIIRKKTASLLAASCAAGVETVGASDEQIDLMGRFGYAAGMAYQIKDDLFDFGNGSIGKPTGTDLKEKKMTLPLIYSLHHASSSRSKEILKLVKKKKGRKESRKEILSFISHHKGMEYANEKMNEFKDEAISILTQFPDNDCNKALVGLLHYMIKRKY